MSKTAVVDYPARIALLQKRMKALGLDGYIVPRYDAHQGEYVADHDARLAWLTGFTGSAGMALITADLAAMFVDGRYTVQVRNQCPHPVFEHHHFFDDPIDLWLAKHMQHGQSIGFDAMLLPPNWHRRFAKAAEAAGAQLIAIEHNPVDAIWTDQPPPPLGRITAFALQFAGRSFTEKRTELLDQMRVLGAQHCVETQPDNIAWFLNVRGNDVAYNPIPHSFLLIDKAGATSWFVDSRKLDSALLESLPEGLSVYEPAAFLRNLGAAVNPGDKVMLDPDFSPVAALLAVEKAGGKPLEQRSPITLTKACKNRTELSGLRDCHVEDGIAWVQFSEWLAKTVPERAALGNPVSEHEAEEKMLAFRQMRPGFIYDSFNPISAAAGNAAMCHYATSATSNAPILPQSPYLLDSGGQYETGTTDATRSFAFGQRPEGYDRAYTAVFKAFVALATLRFPKGTQGHHIDAICRRPLWDLGMDYDHGTGHGIGHSLSVHEQPQRIGKPYNPVDLKPGMVMSIEPGHYLAEVYGIRIENLFEIVEAEDGYMEFANLTLIPIQTEMLQVPMLSQAERLWLNSYHAEVFKICSQRIGASEWLAQACAPI